MFRLRQWLVVGGHPFFLAINLRVCFTYARGWPQLVGCWKKREGCRAKIHNWHRDKPKYWGSMMKHGSETLWKPKWLYHEITACNDGFKCKVNAPSKHINHWQVWNDKSSKMKKIRGFFADQKEGNQSNISSNPDCKKAVDSIHQWDRSITTLTTLVFIRRVLIQGVMIIGSLRLANFRRWHLTISIHTRTEWRLYLMIENCWAKDDVQTSSMLVQSAIMRPPRLLSVVMISPKKRFPRYNVNSSLLGN